MELAPEPLSAETFAPFGDVIETAGASNYLINEDHCTRFHDLAAIDVNSDGGRPLINIFRTRAWDMPLAVKMMEYHALSSQAFIPLANTRFLNIVAPPGDVLDPATLRAFVSDGAQGVNYHRRVWHHPLVALAGVADFLVIDRGAEGEDCVEHHFAEAEWKYVNL
jgi:ureidoglycolate lyase